MATLSAVQFGLKLAVGFGKLVEWGWHQIKGEIPMSEIQYCLTSLGWGVF